MDDLQLRYLSQPSPWPRRHTPSPVDPRMPMLGSTIQHDAESSVRLPLQVNEGQDWDPDASDTKPVLGQQPRVRPARRGVIRTILPWAGEIACCLLGMVAMVAVVVILKCYDGQPQPEFAFKITINALVQFITTAGTRLVSFSIASAVGQLAWLTFTNRTRPLLDFELHQDASYGGFGPLRLLWHLRFSLKWPLQWLAAILAVCSFLISPITQQAITIVSINVPRQDGIATAPRATTFSRSNGTIFRPDPSDELLIEESIVSAAYLGTNSSVTPLGPQCSTADCTWPRYGSLSVCVDLVNVTDPKSRTTLGFYANRTIQESSFLFNNITNAYPAMTLLSPFPTDFLNASATQATVIEFFIAFSPNLVANITDGNVEGYNYFHVAFYFCTKTFETRVDQGEPRVVEVARALDIITAPTGVNSTNSWWSAGSFLPNTTDSPCASSIIGKSVKLRGAADLHDEAYEVDICTALVFSQLFGFILNSAAVWAQDFSTLTRFGSLSDTLGLFLFGAYPAKKVFDPATQLNNMKKLVENIADGATNFIRHAGVTSTGSLGPAQGLAYLPQPTVIVRWTWILLLGIYVMLAALLLVATIGITYVDRIEPYKRSVLAASTALDPDLRSSLGTLKDPEELRRVAGATDVTLATGVSDDGVAFVRSRRPR